MAKSIYSFLKVMKDKLYQKTIDYSKNDWESVNRIEKTHLSMMDNLYYITDSPTFIRDNIYLGNAYNASNYDELKKNKIGYILNITKEISNYYPDDFTYYNIEITDNNGQPIEKYFTEILDFIKISQKDSEDSEDSTEPNNSPNILIHCFMGSSRSASCVILYLIDKYGMTFDESYKMIKELRPIVNPNTSFVKQLKKYEISIKSPIKTTNNNKIKEE